MTDPKLDDRCPECGCNEWTGYCGHFDCHACKWLRNDKNKISRYYEKSCDEVPASFDSVRSAKPLVQGDSPELHLRCNDRIEAAEQRAKIAEEAWDKLQKENNSSTNREESSIEDLSDLTQKFNGWKQSVEDRLGMLEDSTIPKVTHESLLYEHVVKFVGRWREIDIGDRIINDRELHGLMCAIAHYVDVMKSERGRR